MTTKSVQTSARIAGALFLLSFLAGGFGELYVPSKLIVSGDATATANNINALNTLFRLGFAAYLIEACCDIALSLILFVLLKPVQKYLALLAAFFGLVGTAVFAFAELFYLAPALILGGAGYLKAFSPDQLNALALLSLRSYGYGSATFTVFYGVAWLLRGYLILQSRYLPKFLGVLCMLTGFVFVTRNFALVLAPRFPSEGTLLLMLPGMLLLTAWLLGKGVDLAKWEERVATSV